MYRALPYLAVLYLAVLYRAELYLAGPRPPPMTACPVRVGLRPHRTGARRPPRAGTGNGARARHA